MLRTPAAIAAVAGLLMAGHVSAAASINCEHVRVDEVSYDFSALDKEHLVRWYKPLEDDTTRIANISFYLNICSALDKSSDKRAKECPQGTRICGIEDVMKSDGSDVQKDVAQYPIAVSDHIGVGHSMDPKWTRDAEQHSLRLEVKGRPHDDVPLRGIVDFVCKKGADSKSVGRRADDDDGDGKGDGDDTAPKDVYKDHPDWEAQKSTDDGDGGKITFVKWGFEAGDAAAHVLRLRWDTVRACDDAFDDPNLKKGTSGGWGFFSWLFFLSFLGIIAYFAFFAWINYTRFGKSGFDMLPHADTLRELPQLLGEFSRRVLNSLRGGNASGGYSAL